jgi:hypothetical protein
VARSYYVTDNGEALKPLRQRQEKAETAFGAHATVQELEAKIVKVKADTSAIQQAQADKERHWAEQAARQKEFFEKNPEATHGDFFRAEKAFSAAAKKQMSPAGKGCRCRHTWRNRNDDS